MEIGKVKIRGQYLCGSLLTLAVAAALTSCGGGSSNIRDPNQPNPPEVPEEPGDPGSEVALDTHLTITQAYAAHAEDYTGQGVIVGVIDTGVNRDHPALAGRVIDNLVYVDPSSNDLSVDDFDGHGTSVAQLLAGSAVGSWPGGIAPGAQIVSARIISDNPNPEPGGGDPNPGGGSGGVGLAPIHQAMIDRGVKILNNSWGGWSWTNPVTTQGIGDEYRAFVNSHGGLVVFATGNDGAAESSDMAHLPSKALPGGGTSTDLERGWLAVAAVDSLNPTQLADYSNACGSAKDYCLVAPGTAVYTGHNDQAGSPTYYQASGTSIAAPLVSGAAALVWEKFPYFTNDLVRQTLLGTATDLGNPGVDSTYGYGLLNIEAAMKGPAQLNWGAVTADFDGYGSEWSNNISGAGGIIKRGSGTLVLSGENTYQGETRVESGVLQAQNLSGSNVSVFSGARLIAGGLGEDPTHNRGRIVGNMTNSGTVELGRGGLELQGNYVQDPSGALALNIGDNFVISGTAKLDGNIHILGRRDYVSSGTTWNVLDASGGITGTFSTVSSTSNVLISSDVTYMGNVVRVFVKPQLVVTALQQVGSINRTALESAVRVDSAFNKLNQALNDSAGTTEVPADFHAAAGELQYAATKQNIGTAIESLSGDLHAMASAMTFDTIDMQRRSLSTRFDALSSGDRLTAGVWSNRLGEAGRGGYVGNDFSVSGWTMGSDMPLGHSAVVGFAFSETKANNYRSTQYGRSHDRQAQGQFYLGALRGNAYALGQVGFGRYDRYMNRYLQLGGASSGAHANYTGNFMSASFESGYRFDLGNVSMTPYVGMDYARVENDGFNEVGGNGFGLRADRSASERTQAIAGLRGEHRWRNLTWRSYAEWQQAVASSGLDYDASFVAIDSWTSLSGLQPSRSGGLFGVSVDSMLSKNTWLSLGYDQRFGPRGGANMLSATFRTDF